MKKNTCEPVKRSDRKREYDSSVFVVVLVVHALVGTRKRKNLLNHGASHGCGSPPFYTLSMKLS